jgi:hypothetical protein
MTAPGAAQVKDRVSGSGKAPRIPSDVGSAVLDELVEQAAAARAQKTVEQSVADGATARIVIGGWRQDVFIQDLALHNLTANALADADTDIALRYREDGDKNMAAAGTPVEKFFVEGFDSGNMPAGSSRYADEFQATVLGTAITTAFSPFVLPANTLLYIEVINNEGGARLFGATVEYAIMDGIRLQPHNLGVKVPQRVRNFRRGDRQTLLGS